MSEIRFFRDCNFESDGGKGKRLRETRVDQRVTIGYRELEMDVRLERGGEGERYEHAEISTWLLARGACLRSRMVVVSRFCTTGIVVSRDAGIAYRVAPASVLSLTFR